MAFKGDSIFWVEVDKVVANPFQPRREFNEAKLQELADSVKMYGVLQPLTVTRKEVNREDGTFYSEYELIAGERRLRASKLAGLAQVPVIIREGEQSEQEKLELAIIENLQREDLNAVDRALAFRQLADTFELSHAQVAKKVGRSREYVSNTMRLLLLPDYMLESLKVADITEGHARTLLMLNDRPEEQDTVYREILLKKLSVREVERIARKIATDKVRKQKWKNSDPELIEMEKKFTESLGTRVQIAKTDYGGKISIDYFSDEDLEELLGRLKKDREAQASSREVSAVATAVTHVSAERYDEEQEMIEKMEAATPLVSEETIKPTESPQTESLENKATEQQREREETSSPAPVSQEETSLPEQISPESVLEKNDTVEEQTPPVSDVPPMRPQEAAQHSHEVSSTDSVSPEKKEASPEHSQSSVESASRQPQEVEQEMTHTKTPEAQTQEPSQQQKQHEPFMTMDDAKRYEKEKEDAASDESDLYGLKNFSI